MSLEALWAVPLLWLAVMTVIVFWYRHDIDRLWREPALRYPVLVLESDDWGAGPLGQVAALDDLAALLCRFRDSSGHAPVMSLAVVLSVPDGKAIDAEARYQRTCLSEPALAVILDALKRGEAEGAFSLQLHGSEHFWPETLMEAVDPNVRSWLRQPSPASTEQLPPHLQSRWTDASSLPSRPLTGCVVDKAAREEVEIYKQVIGRAPSIVVPPTFLWTPDVERAWAANGITCVITPGQRYTLLAADGSHVADEARFANGDRHGDLIYLVRYDYFEPAKGRDADYALRALRRASSEGRPCTLENHRSNFCQDQGMRLHSLAELEKLIAGALILMPTVRFLSSGELLGVLTGRDSQWIALRFAERFPYFWQRLRHAGRLWKLLKLSGLALPGELLMRWALRSGRISHV